MSSSLAAREDELNHYSNVETMRSIGAPDPPYEESVRDVAGAQVSLRVRGSGERLGEAGWKGAAIMVPASASKPPR